MTKDEILKMTCVHVSKRNLLPKVKCVYFVIDFNDDIVYIGKTLNLSARWRSHEKISKLDNASNTRITWIQCDKMDDLELFKTEQEFIRQFNPILNKAVNEQYKEVKRRRNCKVSKTSFTFSPETIRLLEKYSNQDEAPKSRVIEELIKGRRDRELDSGKVTLTPNISIPEDADVASLVKCMLDLALKLHEKVVAK